MRDIHFRYGEVVRIAPTELNYANEQAIKDIFSHKPGQEESPKNMERQQLPPNGIRNILGADKDVHSRYRRLLAHAFSEKGLKEQEPLIKQYVDLLVDRLLEEAAPGETTDMWSGLTSSPSI